MLETSKCFVWLSTSGHLETQVSCRDGSLEPASPECLAGCANGPDVQFATNIHECVRRPKGPRVGFWLDKPLARKWIEPGPKASATSGSICSIRCQAAAA